MCLNTAGNHFPRNKQGGNQVTARAPSRTLPLSAQCQWKLILQERHSGRREQIVGNMFCMPERARRCSAGYHEIIMHREEKKNQTGQQQNNNISGDGSCTNRADSQQHEADNG